MPISSDAVEPAPAVAALLELAAERATGVLEFPADPGGAVYLVKGFITQVVSATTDAPERREPGHRRPGLWERALPADAAADAALALLGRARADTSPRFRPGERHATPLTPPLEVAELLAEIARRERVLASIAGRSRPDEPLTRAARLPVERVRLTARQWALVRLADGRHTPRELARQLGSGVFATTVEAATLVRAGLLTPVSGEAGTPTPFLEAVSGA